MALTALSDADICSMALSHLGISQTIQSISPPDTGSVAAQSCAFWYPKRRDWLLRSAPWNFAFTFIPLAVDGTVFPGYRYSYQYPDDCLEAVAVVTQAGQRTANGIWNGWWFPQGGMGYTIPKIPYKIVQSQVNPGELAICCDILATPGAPLYLFYIQGVTNTAQFDVMFCDTLSFDVGQRIGGVMRADPTKIQYCQAMAQKGRLDAIAQFMNEMQQDPARESPSTIARW